MRDISTLDYSALDRPDILRCVFHPRREWGMGAAATTGRDVLVPVGGDVAIGGRFHVVEPRGANILHFHGNGVQGNTFLSWHIHGYHTKISLHHPLNKGNQEN